MKLEGERTVPAPRQTVWEALNDETLLIECIPGCEALERLADTELAASVTAKVGPVKAKLKGEVRLENVVAPHSYTLIGQGKGAAGFARGRADVALHEAGDSQTLLVYSVEASVGGKLAQMGGRLVEGTAKKYADEFFDCFSKLSAERAQQVEAAAPTRVEPAPPSAEAIEQAQPVPPSAAAPVPPTEPVPKPERRAGLPPAVWAVVLILVVLALLYLFA